jgi:hypothetical protein
MRSSRTSCVVAASLVATFCSQLGMAGGKWSIIARPGDPIPGAPGFTFSGANTAFRNGSGKTVFWASGGAGAIRGTWAAEGNQTYPLATSFMSPPSGLSLANFAMTPQHIDEQGNVVLSGASGGISTIAYAPNGAWTGLQGSGVLWSAANQYAYPLTDGHLAVWTYNPGVDTALWNGTIGQPLQRVIGTGDFLPGWPSNTWASQGGTAMLGVPGSNSATGTAATGLQFLKKSSPFNWEVSYLTVSADGTCSEFARSNFAAQWHGVPAADGSLLSVGDVFFSRGGSSVFIATLKGTPSNTLKLVRDGSTVYELPSGYVGSVEPGETITSDVPLYLIGDDASVIVIQPQVRNVQGLLRKSPLLCIRPDGSTVQIAAVGAPFVAPGVTGETIVDYWRGGSFASLSRPNARGEIFIDVVTTGGLYACMWRPLTGFEVLFKSGSVLSDTRDNKDYLLQTYNGYAGPGQARGSGSAGAPCDDGAMVFSMLLHEQGGGGSTLACVILYEPTSACLGDLNNDGFVDDSDFVGFAAAYNLLDCSDATMPTNCPADFNGDDFIDDADFVIFAAAYNELVCP